MTLTERLAPSAARPIKPVGAEGGGDDAADWTAGTYRAAFTYITNQEQPFAQGTVAQSASFVIGYWRCIEYGGAPVSWSDAETPLCCFALNLVTKCNPSTS